MQQSLSISILILVHMLFREPSTLIIAHRGASHDAPENTLAAVNLAWVKEADAVEVDVHLSKDNRIMVIHDADTKRTTGDKMVVRESFSEALRTLDASFGMAAYRGERIPYLEEVIEAVPDDKLLFIEVKTDTVILPYLTKLLDGHPKQSRLVVISFDFEVCTGIKRQIPDIPVFWLHYTLSGSYRSKWIEKARAAGLDGLNLRYKGINQDYVEAVHWAGLKMFAWTVDQPEDAARLIESGIDGITTNRPGWLREQLGKQGL